MTYRAPRRNRGVSGLLLTLGALGGFILLMGMGLVIQNVDCRCVVSGTPEWAWLLAPVLVVVAGVVVIGCTAFWVRFPSLGFRRNTAIALIAAGAIESAVVLGTSRAFIVAPYEQAFIPLTAAVLVVCPLTVLALRMFGGRGRAATA